MDLSDPDAIRRAVREAKPDLIVNAAAYTAVDQAESEPELALAINGVAPGILAEEAKRLGAALIHYSTDYVFDGSKAAPYTEDDEPRPINVYGRTKLAGERAIQAVDVPHLILRTSWVYGARGKNFLLTILRLAQEREELSIVDDQIGAPTWSRAIAMATGGILDAPRLRPAGVSRCLRREARHLQPDRGRTNVVAWIRRGDPCECRERAARQVRFRPRLACPCSSPSRPSNIRCPPAGRAIRCCRTPNYSALSAS